MGETERLLYAVADYCRVFGLSPSRIKIFVYTEGGKDKPAFVLPVSAKFLAESPRREEQTPVSPPVAPRQTPRSEGSGFQPNDFQMKVLDALEFRALRSVPLGVEVGDKRDLYRHPGGIRELREHGLVRVSQRHGYYRPDMPPEELADAAKD